MVVGLARLNPHVSDFDTRPRAVRWRPPTEVVIRLLLAEIFTRFEGHDVVIYTLSALTNHIFDRVGDLALTRWLAWCVVELSAIHKIQELLSQTHPLKPSAWSDPFAALDSGQLVLLLVLLLLVLLFIVFYQTSTKEGKLPIPG